jgi:tRNA threonylcarbamoyl adenosine modification protein (Sua5/YciO/YrdC/YwlC family)
MNILSTDNPLAISSAMQVLQQDGLIAFPTDTIYGLAASAFNPKGILKIYAAKQRSEEKALPILIGDFSQLDSLVLFIREPVRRIAETFWPGALTLILPKGPNIPSELSGYPTIGIRMPNLAFTLNLLQKTGPLATTSANISDGPNPTSAEDVVAQLGEEVDLILDGGPTPGPIASTVVDASGPSLKILREGPITLVELESVFEE